MFSQTALLRNRCYVDYLKQGYVIGNNINLDYNKDWDSDDEEDDEKFAGAFNTNGRYKSSLIAGTPLEPKVPKCKNL